MLTIAPLEDLTVRLCLAEDKPLAGDLLQRWNEDIDIDTMSFGIMRLVPLIHHQITRFGLSSPHEKRLKVIYKFWWVAYQHRGNQLQQVHTLLGDHGIPMMIIKGAGLIDYYENPVHRPMADIDVLVPTTDHSKALDLLLNNLWVLEYPESYKGNLLTTKLGLDAPHGVSLINTITDTKLDLHRRIGSNTSNQVSDWVWSSAVPSVSLPGLNKPAIHLELLMIVVHAVMASFNDNLNWLVDLAHLQKRLTEEDWERALEAAMAERKADIFLFGCHLARQYGISIPTWLPDAETPNFKIPSGPVRKPSIAWIKRVNSALYFTVHHRHPSRALPLKWAMHVYIFAVRGFIFLGRSIRGSKLDNTRT
jgi:hypothetical protein